MVNKYLDAMNDCLEDFRWQDAVLFKICVCSFGIMFGMLLPKRWRRAVLIVSILAFTAACIPLMSKLFPAFRDALCTKCNGACE